MKKRNLKSKRNYKNYIIPIVLTVLFLGIILGVMIIGINGVLGATNYITDQGITTKNITATGNFIGDGSYIQNSTPQIVFTTNGKGDYSCSATEDCQSKIQSAIARLGSTGGTIYFKAGTYWINSTINLNKTGVTLAGDDVGGGRITPSNTTIIKALPTFTPYSDMINVSSGGATVIRGITVYGNTSVTKNGINFNGAGTRFYVYDTAVLYQNESGFLVSAGIDSDSYMTRINSMQNNKHGIEILRGDMSINKYYARQNGKSAIYTRAGNVEISDIHAYGFENCIYLNGTDYITVTNFVCESASKDTIVIDSDGSSTDRNSFSTGVFYANNGTGGYHNFYLHAPTNVINELSIVGVVSDATTNFINYTGDESKITNVALIGNTYPAIGNKPTNVVAMDSSTINGVWDFHNGQIFNSPSVEQFSPNSIIASYNFDKNSISGANIYDGSGNNYDTTYNANVTYSTIGGLANSAYFNFMGNPTTSLGSDGVLVTNITTQLDTTLPFSVSIWFNITSASSQGSGAYSMVSKDTGVYPLVNLFMRTNQPQFRYAQSGGSDVTSKCNAGYNDGTWHQLVGVYDGTNISVYCDGILQDSDAISVVANTSTKALIIGGNNGGAGNKGFTNGSLDSIIVFNRALSNQEIMQLYSQKVRGEDRRSQTTFNDVNPSTNALYNLGTSLLRWIKGWFVDIDVSGVANIATLNVTGNSTIQQGNYQCFNANCSAYQTYNGTTLIIKVT